MATTGWLFAAGFHSGNLCQIRWEIVRRKSLNIHFDQADERTPEVWFCRSAAIDNYADSRDDTTVGGNDVDCLLHAAVAGDDVFNYDESLVGRDLKTAAQNKLAIFFFNEDVAFA